MIVIGLLAASAPAVTLLVTNNDDQTVKQYDPNTGAFIGNLVTTGSGGLSWPTDLHLSPLNELLVSNYDGGGGNPTLLRYNFTTGASLGTFATVTNTQSLGAWGWDFGPDGNVYASSFLTHEVKRFNGTTGAFIDDFVTAGSGGLQAPEGLVFSPDGTRLLVGSRNTNEVLEYDAGTGAFIGVFGQANNIDSALVEPSSLFFGPDGNLYVVDQNTGTDVVKRYDASGNYLGGFVSGGPSLANAADAAFGPDGNFYIARGGAVHRFDGATGVYIDEFVTAGSGGLSGHGFLLFAEPQELQAGAAPEPATMVSAALAFAALAMRRRQAAR